LQDQIERYLTRACHPDYQNPNEGTCLDIIVKMFNLKSFSNSNPASVMPADSSSHGSRKGHTKGAGNGQHAASNNNNHCKKKRSRRRRKPKCNGNSTNSNKAESSNSSKKQHDAPMTKRDLYFSLACEVVRTADSDDLKGLSVARVTIVNWDMEVVLDTFVEVPAPVTDLMGTGITATDIHQNPQAMDFATVRETVERILCGKILIGYQLRNHLTALGLGHPSTDVRDAAFYGGSREEDERSIEVLAEEILQRSLPDKSERHRSIEVCIAALDLYKANRKEWEMRLIQRARESERQSHQELAPSPNHRQMPYGAAPQQRHAQPQEMMYPIHRVPSHQQEYPKQQATVPTNYLPAAASHPYGPGTYLSHSLQQQQQAMVMAARNPTAAQASRSNSSWFSLGRKPRYPQQPPAVSMPSNAQASLSSQALEALSFPNNSSFDYYDGSSAYDGSTGYDRSTDYGSSAPGYGGSLVSESVGSVISESVGSVLSEPVELSCQDDSENIPAGGEFGRHQNRQQASENSSWFRFGSRKSRYGQQQQQQREPMTVVQESNEPVVPESNEAEEPVYRSEDYEPEFADDARTPNCDPSRYENGGVSEEKKHSSSWFGFKRAKSPAIGKKEKPEEPVEGQEEVELMAEAEPLPSDDQNPPAPDNSSAKAEAPATEKEKQSSWFKFGRRSSMRSKSPSPDTYLQEDRQPVDEVVTLHTESSEATDEDWWQEVMNQPNNNIKPEEQQLETQSAHSEQQWIEDKSSDNLASDGQIFEQSGSKSSTWFRFLRSSKSNLHDASPMMKKEETGDCLEQSSQSGAFDQNGGDEWIGEAARSFDRSCLGPAWYGSADQQQSDAQQPEADAVVTFSPHFKEMDFDGLLAPRARLHTESTIPSVATEPEDFEEFSQEFVQGMEKNLTFLNI